MINTFMFNKLAGVH